MKLLTRWRNLAMCASVALASAGYATMEAVAQPAPASLVEILDLSSRLYQEGIARGDALLVLAAARLRLSRLDIEPNADADVWISGRSMLGEAEALAASDPSLREAITRLRDETERGGLDGPQVASVRVAGQSELHLAHAFRNGRPAYVYAEGAPTSRLSLTVLEARSEVCRTAVEIGRALCRWVAAQDGPVTTVVRNHTGTPATILVVTN